VADLSTLQQLVQSNTVTQTNNKQGTHMRYPYHISFSSLMFICACKAGHCANCNASRIAVPGAQGHIHVHTFGAKDDAHIGQRGCVILGGTHTHTHFLQDASHHIIAAASQTGQRSCPRELLHIAHHCGHEALQRPHSRAGKHCPCLPRTFLHTTSLRPQN